MGDVPEAHIVIELFCIVGYSFLFTNVPLEYTVNIILDRIYNKHLLNTTLIYFSYILTL